MLDLATEYPASFESAEAFASILKKIMPRLYSIASSPNAHPEEVHLCVGAVRYTARDRKRGGVCSTYMADRLQPGHTARVFVHTNKNFRLPEDGDTPIIMVGPGTGIAPFRAFWEERIASGDKGGNWLFFGNPYKATDFCYEDELAKLTADGRLKLSVAWSRDQEKKVYVQHLMVQEGEELWKWLENGACFYVCGDASRMAKDVDAALHEVIQTWGHKTPEEAAEYVADMKQPPLPAGRVLIRYTLSFLLPRLSTIRGKALFLFTTEKPLPVNPVDAGKSGLPFFLHPFFRVFRAPCGKGIYLPHRNPLYNPFTRRDQGRMHHLSALSAQTHQQFTRAWSLSNAFSISAGSSREQACT